MMMQFRFECVKNSELEDNVFDDVEYPTNLRVVHEFEMSDETRWHNIIAEFAKFLDALGYVGVYERVMKRNELEWEFITNKLEEYNEDISGA
jgi:hypothetical protein